MEARETSCCNLGSNEESGISVQSLSNLKYRRDGGMHQECIQCGQGVNLYDYSGSQVENRKDRASTKLELDPEALKSMLRVCRRRL